MYDTMMEQVKFKVISNKKNNYQQELCKFTNRNASWRSAHTLQQEICLQLNELTSIKYLVIDNFNCGSEMSILLSDDS